MQCPSCRAVYSNGLDFCPRCKTPASKSPAEAQPAEEADSPLETIAHAEETEACEAVASTGAETESEAEKATPQPSTLLEFPGVSRNKPQWRKELSERVREIQERRSREGVREAVAHAAHLPSEQQAPATQLGLVPQPDAPAINPIVAAALKRLERARQTTAPVGRTRATMGGAATAVARVAEEQYQAEEKQELELGTLSLQAPESQAEPFAEEKPIEAPRERERTLVVVPSPPQASKAQATIVQAERETEGAIIFDEAGLDDSDETMLDASALREPYDDRAPVVSRVVGSLIDLLVVAFAASPFAAIIELTNGDWSDARVLCSMGGIIVTIMFLYLTASTALAGRTW